MRRPSRLLGTAGVAAGTALLLDTLRVWLPSVIFVYGRAGSTPATDMGAFALVPFAVAFAGVLAVRVLPAPVVTAVAAVLFAAARVGLQATQGGDPHLWVGTAGVVAGLLWLVAVAGSAPARVGALGLVVGLSVDASAHAMLRSTGLAWRPGVLPWLALLAAAAVLLGGVWRQPVGAHGPGEAAPGSARGWAVVGPLLVLHGILGGVVSHLHTVTGWPEPAAVAVVVGAHGTAAVAAWWAIVGGAGRAAARMGAAVVIAGLGAAQAHPPGPGEVAGLAVGLTAAGHLLLPIGTALALGGLVAAPSTAGDVGRAAACAAGLLGFYALAFGYYAAYDLPLPFANTVLLWIAAAAVAAVAIIAHTVDAEPRPRLAREVLTGLAGASAGASLAAVVVAAVADPPVPVEGDGLPARVMTYNLQMGFDIHGRHSVDRLAAAIGDDGALVVGVQEVSRGWLINSATDVLPRLAEQTGMGYAFTPAADPVWGNAVLSPHPLHVVEELVLPQGRAPMRRSAQALVVDLGDGVELGVVNTHLTHPAEEGELRAEQVIVVAGMARRLAADGRPVVVLGDLNAEPGSPELAPLEEWLSHAWDDPPTGTFPSWHPTRLLDHILVTDDLEPRDYRVGDSRASDHLPASATLNTP